MHGVVQARGRAHEVVHHAARAQRVLLHVDAAHDPEEGRDGADVVAVLGL